MSEKGLIAMLQFALDGANIYEKNHPQFYVKHFYIKCAKFCENTSSVVTLLKIEK